MNSHTTEEGSNAQAIHSSPFVIRPSQLPLTGILPNHVEILFPDDRPTGEGEGQCPNAIQSNKLIHNFLKNNRLPYETQSGSLFSVDIGRTTSMNIQIYYDPINLKRYVIEFQCKYNNDIDSSINNIFKKFKGYINFHQRYQNNYDEICQELIGQLNTLFEPIQQTPTLGGLEWATTTFDALRHGAVLPQVLHLDSYKPIIDILELLNMLIPTISNLIDCLIKHLTALTRQNRFAVHYILTILMNIMMTNKNEFIFYLHENNLMEELKSKFETLLENIDELTSNRHGEIINPIQSNTLYSDHKNIIICIQRTIS